MKKASLKKHEKVFTGIYLHSLKQTSQKLFRTDLLLAQQMKKVMVYVSSGHMLWRRKSGYPISIQCHLWIPLHEELETVFYWFVGIVDEEDIADTDRNWTDYWRLLFPKIDLNDISEFEQKYKGCIIRSFIHYEHFYSAPSRWLLGSTPDSSTATKSSVGESTS